LGEAAGWTSAPVERLSACLGRRLTHLSINASKGVPGSISLCRRTRRPSLRSARRRTQSGGASDAAHDFYIISNP